MPETRDTRSRGAAQGRRVLGRQPAQVDPLPGEGRERVSPFAGAHRQDDSLCTARFPVTEAMAMIEQGDRF